MTLEDVVISVLIIAGFTAYTLYSYIKLKRDERYGEKVQEEP